MASSPAQGAIILESSWYGFSNVGSTASATNNVSLFGVSTSMQNLIQNGGFEYNGGLNWASYTVQQNGNQPNSAYFANPTPPAVSTSPNHTANYGPTLAIPSWTATGGDTGGQSNGQGNYATWGPGASLNLGAGNFVQGSSGVYFGNYYTASQTGAPHFDALGNVTGISNINASVTLAGVPTPVTLSQTISGLTVAQKYSLSFWVTGESAGLGGSSSFTGGDGVMQLRVTEGATVTSDLLAVPQGSSTLNTNFSSGFGTAGHYYQFELTPTTSTVTLDFVNWGHVTGVNGNHATEMILDDVTLVQIPEPGVLLLLGIAGVLVAARRFSSTFAARRPAKTSPPLDAGP